MCSKKCECESSVHFASFPSIHSFQEVPATQVVETTFGKFEVCKDCAENCLVTFKVK